MTGAILNAERVKDLIKDGKSLILAGDEKVLVKLPPGNWIGGTIPYFMGKEGGFFSQDVLFVNEVPEYAISKNIRVYQKESIQSVYDDIPERGFSIIIIPASCSTHLTFALHSPNFDGFASKPLIGWVSGVFLDDLDSKMPKIVNGRSSELLEDGAVVMHIGLPYTKIAEIQIINIFSQGNGDTITFPVDGFSARDAYVNGLKVNFAQYLSEKEIDTKLPLVANVYNEMINTSFQSADTNKGQVSFFAPVFSGIRYKMASPVDDYVQSFARMIPQGLCEEKIYFSCNCILNYIYAGLEGKKTMNFTGPFTFGEIAYQLLNQTCAYIMIDDV